MQKKLQDGTAHTWIPKHFNNSNCHLPKILHPEYSSGRTKQSRGQKRKNKEKTNPGTQSTARLLRCVPAGTASSVKPVQVWAALQGAAPRSEIGATSQRLAGVSWAGPQATCWKEPERTQKWLLFRLPRQPASSCHNRLASAAGRGDADTTEYDVWILEKVHWECSLHLIIYTLLIRKDQAYLQAVRTCLNKQPPQASERSANSQSKITAAPSMCHINAGMLIVYL